MEDQVPFKVYTFWKEGDKPEVRRFGVEKSVVTSYHYLNAKIQDVYPRLKGKTYSVTWRDDDGDDIVISSDDEVMTALQALGGDVIKLFIYCKGGDARDDDIDIVITATTENPNGTTGPNTLHCGVVCDSCNSPVVGFRYKCTVCDDFDLCSQCEASGCHPEHCMVRVPTPTMSRTLIKAAIKRSRHFLKSVGTGDVEGCHYKKHRRERSGERRHRGERGAAHAAHATHAGEYHHRRPRSGWLDTFATYMNEFANLAGDFNIDTDKPKPPENKPQEKPKTSTQSTEAPQPDASTSANAQAQCPNAQTVPVFPSASDLSKVKSLLDYLNKDLSAFIPQSPASATTTASATASASAYATAQNEDVEMGQGDAKTSEASNVSVKTEVSASSDQERDVSPDKGDDWTLINKEKDLMDTIASAPQEAAAPIGFNLPEEFQERVKISEGALYPPLHTATAVLNPKEAEAASAQQFAGQAQAAAAPPQAALPVQAQAAAAPRAAEKPATAPPQPRQRHPKPHIEAAIQHMLAMGFTNEGDWLTQLLESKDGNIAAVLDLLTPVNPKK